MLIVYEFSLTLTVRMTSFGNLTWQRHFISDFDDPPPECSYFIILIIDLFCPHKHIVDLYMWFSKCPLTTCVSTGFENEQQIGPRNTGCIANSSFAEVLNCLKVDFSCIAQQMDWFGPSTYNMLEKNKGVTGNLLALSSEKAWETQYCCG